MKQWASGSNAELTWGVGCACCHFTQVDCSDPTWFESLAFVQHVASLLRRKRLYYWKAPEKLHLQRSCTDIPLCADCWSAAGMNLPLWRSFSPETLNIFSGQRCVHEQPVREFRTDVPQIFLPASMNARHNFRTYLTSSMAETQRTFE